MYKKYYTTLFVLLMSISFIFSQQTINGTLEHDGETREFTVFLPSIYEDGMNLPLVMNLHGITSNSAQQTFYTSMHNVADTANFIVVTPNGLIGTTTWGQTAQHWNSYFGTGVDDLGFLNKLIDQMYTDYDIDLSRVYSTGMSNGGFMSHRLACELSDRIAAIASVTGSVAFEQFDNCSPDRAVPVMQVHGTADAVVPFNGTPLFSSSAPDLVAFWVNMNNCSTQADTVDIPNISSTDNSTAQILKYNNGDDDAKVWFYVIENGGHTWPGSILNLPNVVTNQDFKASNHVWEFFNQFQHPDPADGTLIPTSNDDFLLENIKVIVYPSNRELVVTSGQENIQKIQLWDLLGKPILQINQGTPQSEIHLDLPNVPTGIYIVTVKTETGFFTQKVFF